MSATPPRLVAYLGERGTFSEEASRRFLPACTPMPMGDFASVARAVREGSADVAVLPVANSSVGAIAAVRELLKHPELRVIGEETLEVRLHLLAGAETTIEHISEVASHPAALAQCARFLDGRMWRRTEMASTAHAVRQVAIAADPGRACLASEDAAALYGLRILARDIHDQADNRTTFAIVERRDQFA